MKNSWDKLILIGAGIAVLAVSGLFIAKAISMDDNFVVESQTPDSTVEPTDVDAVKTASAWVQQEVKWNLPNKGEPPKPLPLFKSITIVEVDGKLIDMMDPTSESVRPPVSNKWLIENELDFLKKSVLMQDPDGDGFSNREEWDAKTSPKDPEAHPPFAAKLNVVSRRAKSYVVKFAAKPDAERFQIIRLPTSAWPKRETMILRVGETSSDGQFRVEGYEEKEVVQNGITKDASVVKITYLPSGKEEKLIKNVDTKIPTYYGELSFELGTVEPKYIKEGDTFTLSTDQKNKYRLKKIEEESAEILIESENGEEKTVEIGKKG